MYVTSPSKLGRAFRPRPESRAARVLELVHSDVMGPFPCARCLSGEKYVVTSVRRLLHASGK